MMLAGRLTHRGMVIPPAIMCTRKINRRRCAIELRIKNTTAIVVAGFLPSP
jgi:hypothetical protein